MPCIVTKTNVSISREQEESLKQKLGKTIELIPGKAERWLMLSFEPNCRLWFQGRDDRPLAFVEVKIFGKAADIVYDKMTTALTELFSEELGISPSDLYIKYEEVDHWGWYGGNF